MSSYRDRSNGKEYPIERTQSQRDKHLVHEFCESTTIHGLKYIFEEGSLLIERSVFSLSKSSKRVRILKNSTKIVPLFQDILGDNILMWYCFFNLLLPANVEQMG